jgi:hypothetical protein
MINKDDKIISMLLYNSHESDMTYQRPDSTTYICQIRKNKDDTFRIPETQLSLPLTLPEPPKPSIPQGFPHQDMLKKYYGDDWVPKSRNLPPH